jgi:hypothetical protein
MTFWDSVKFWLARHLVDLLIVLGVFLVLGLAIAANYAWDRAMIAVRARRRRRERGEGT